MVVTFSEEAVRSAVAQISQNIGWNAIGNQSLDILVQVCIRFIKDIGKVTTSFTSHYNRSEVSLDDLAIAFEHLNVSLSELEDYCNNVEPIPFVKGNPPRIPVAGRGASRLSFPDESEAQSRGPQYYEWLPPLKAATATHPEVEPKELTEDLVAETNGISQGEDSPSKLDNSVPSSREKGIGLIKSNFAGIKISGFSDLEPAQVTSVYISSSGEIVGVNGREGRLPDSKLPPKTLEEDSASERNVAKGEKANTVNSLSDDHKNHGKPNPTAPLKLKIKENKKSKKINKENSNGKLVIDSKMKDSVVKKIRREKKEKEKEKEKKKDKSLKSLSIKVSGLTSGTPTATPSPSIARSPKSEHDFDIDHSLKQGNDPNDSVGQKQLDVSVDECISAVIARAVEENGIESENGIGGDNEMPAEEVKRKTKEKEREKEKEKNKEKEKEKKKKERRLKKKKGQLMDETIDDVIKSAMGKTEENAESKDIYSFNEELTSVVPPSLKSNNFVNPVHVDDDKEAAKILVSLAEDKKPKKPSPSKKQSSTPSSSPANISSPKMQSTSPFQSSFSSSSFPKVSPGTTPLSPTSNLFNPFLNPSSASAASSVPTPPLFTPKGDSAFHMRSSSVFRSPFSPPHPQHRTEFGSDFGTGNFASSLHFPPQAPQNQTGGPPKPPLKTLAEKKALPPEIALPVAKKERKEKKKEKKEKEKHEGSKEKEKEGKKEKTKKSKKIVDPVDDLSSSDEKELAASLVPKLMVKIASSTSSATPSPSSTASSTKLFIRTSSPAPSPDPVASMKESRKEKEKEREKRKRKSVTSSKAEKEKEKEKVVKGDASCTVITETISTGENADKVWICPACKKPDDGTPMIGCDGCDDWYHWICVGIKVPPKDEDSWFCNRCIARQQQIESKFKKKKHRYRDK